MDNYTITAIAHEYAEEIYPDLSDKIISLRTLEIKNAERLIRFLLRRYCLVEKSKIKEEYREVKAFLDVATPLADNEPWSYYTGKRIVLKHLFPDLRKEVEL